MTVSSSDVEREAELRAYDVLASTPLPVLDRIADLAALVCGTSTAEVNVITATEQVHLAASDRNTARVPKEDSFCARVIGMEEPVVVVTDAGSDARFSDSPFANGERGAITTYAAARLTSATGSVLGTLCVFDDGPRVLAATQLAALQHLAGIVSDFLETRRVEIELAGSLQRLAGSHRALRASNESLEAFAGQISHDLQSPLTSVELALGLLAEHAALDEKSQLLLDHALSGGRRMQRAITDLLDFAVSGTSTTPVRVALEPVVDQVLLDLGATFTARIEVDALPTVLGQETAVRAVLQNLIANAVKHAATAGRPHIHLSGEVRDGTARITVADDGPGVPVAEREAIFALAVRGTSDAPGHGIGLATCARIVHASGGRIGVDQGPSGGAAFWFELPAAP